MVPLGVVGILRPSRPDSQCSAMFVFPDVTNPLVLQENRLRNEAVVNGGGRK